MVMHSIALLLIDGITLRLRKTEEPADHGQVLPQGPVFWRRIFFPAQQLTQPSLRRKGRQVSLCWGWNLPQMLKRRLQ